MLAGLVDTYDEKGDNRLLISALDATLAQPLPWSGGVIGNRFCILPMEGSDGTEDGKPGDYLTDALTTKAIGFIKDHADKPFFLNLWYYTVHTPIEPRKDKLEKYTAKAKSLGLDTSKPPAISEHQSLTNARQDNPAYAAMVESLDENVGRLMAELDRLGLRENTIVVFFSDNGGNMYNEVDGTTPTSNAPHV